MDIKCWPRLFKGWIALSTGQISIQWILQLVSSIVIRWIAIYPVDSAIQRLNNRGLVPKLSVLVRGERKIKKQHVSFYSKKLFLNSARSHCYFEGNDI